MIMSQVKDSRIVLVAPPGMSESNSAKQEAIELNEQLDAKSGESQLAVIVGRNLRTLRLRRGLTLERLAKASGVSRAMLSQVELGRSMPTIKVVWKVARALELPFSALLSHSRAASCSVLRLRESRMTESSNRVRCFPRQGRAESSFTNCS